MSNLWPDLLCQSIVWILAKLRYHFLLKAGKCGILNKGDVC